MVKKISRWVPKDAKMFNILIPSLERFYIDKEFVEFRRSTKRPEGYYETHRHCKGEDLYYTTMKVSMTEELWANVKEAAVTARMKFLSAKEDERATFEDADEIAMGLDLLEEVSLA